VEIQHLAVKSLLVLDTTLKKGWTSVKPGLKG